MSRGVQRFSSCAMRVSSSMMRRLLTILAFLAAPGSAQTVVPTPVPAPAIPAAAAPWDPGAAYITTGQDEPGYRSWYLAAPERAVQVKSFNDYLASASVD